MWYIHMFIYLVILDCTVGDDPQSRFIPCAWSTSCLRGRVEILAETNHLLLIAMPGIMLLRALQLMFQLNKVVYIVDTHD